MRATACIFQLQLRARSFLPIATTNAARSGTLTLTSELAEEDAMKTCLHHGMVGLMLLGGMATAAAQGAPDVLIERPNLGLPNGAIPPAAELRLTPEQKTEIFEAVRGADAKIKAPAKVPATIGASVPPSIELYILPDRALASVPEAKGVKYTMVQNQVVLVDPTTMRVVDIIRQ
jgi:hypothetical protein